MGAVVPTTLRVDAGSLAAGGVALDALLRDALAPGTCLRFVPPWPESVPPSARAVLRAVPALTIAVSPPEEVDGAFDLVASEGEAGALEAAFARAPIAAVSAALLLRSPRSDVDDGLTAESATYSVLQAGPEFRAWRDATPARPAGDADEPRVRVDSVGDVTEIVLTRPTRHNALDVVMRDALDAALGDAAWRAGGILVRGEGPSFSSGGDLDEFATFPDPATAHVVRLLRSPASRFAALHERLVVAIHGTCLGAGIELAAFADHVVAAEDTRIGLPEQSIGLVPGAGGTVSIARRAGRRSVLALLLRDGTISAAQAREWGLVDEVVPPEEVRARALEIAESLS
jgi:enoyl-CoA hydratase/carnithine racemase